MRWILIYPEVGTTRVLTKFLLLPRCLPVNSKDGRKETRWLEVANIVQEYGPFSCGSYGGAVNCWKSTHFVN